MARGFFCGDWAVNNGGEHGSAVVFAVENDVLARNNGREHGVAVVFAVVNTDFTFSRNT